MHSREKLDKIADAIRGFVEDAHQVDVPGELGSVEMIDYCHVARLLADIQSTIDADEVDDGATDAEVETARDAADARYLLDRYSPQRLEEIADDEPSMLDRKVDGSVGEDTVITDRVDPDIVVAERFRKVAR